MSATALNTKTPDQVKPIWTGSPEPFAADAKAYPLDSLSESIHNAVVEVNSYCRAPDSIVAMCALGTASLAVQPHVNVKRGDIIGPVSLYLLSMAVSGERKTSAERYFLDPVRDWQQEIRKQFAPALARYEAELEAHKIALDAARRATSKEDTATIESLADAIGDAPERVLIPKLLFGDPTPEAMLFRLANNYPSSGLFSSEAGQVFGSHGMSTDTIMRYLSYLNILWDGGTVDIDRRTSESYTLSNARLTQCLAVQPAVMRDFMGRAGDLVEGSGNLARFLMGCPVSTIGTRLYVEEPAAWPALDQYKSRLTTLLSKLPAIDETGALSDIKTISISGYAKQAWIDVYNEIEVSSGAGGELSIVQPAAAKAADNIARVAAVQRVFEDGIEGEITTNDIDSASNIVMWHLSEAVRFAGAEQYSVAKRLEADLLEHNGARERKALLQSGPRVLRKAKTIDSAINDLHELNRAQCVDGVIYLHPELLETKR